MSILVTGAAGFIGMHVCRYLLNRGDIVIGVDNLNEATIDGNPSWSTVNCIYNYNLNTSTSITLGVKNIFDRHYKTFASGISASGRNLVLSIRKKL